MSDHIPNTSKMVVRPIKWTHLPKEEPIFSEKATDIEIVDECGGEFVEVQQHHDGYGKIGITPDEWPTLRKAIDHAVRQCKP
ncbi:MAG: hypothetical protein RL442_1579 [Pseudomonadota bacterium]|jgi:hypothetical protein